MTYCLDTVVDIPSITSAYFADKVVTHTHTHTHRITSALVVSSLDSPSHAGIIPIDAVSCEIKGEGGA